MYKILLAIIVSLSISVSAQNTDATYKLIEKVYTLNEDGSYTMTYKHKLQYHSYRSFHRMYGETFVVYDPEYQEVKVTKSQTTMADGKVVHSPENAFNEVLPRFAAHSGSYNHLRELVITHVGLEREAIVDLEYTITSKKSNGGFFAGYENLQHSSPVEVSRIQFRVPKSMELEFAGNLKNKKVEETDQDIAYSFEYSNLPESKFISNYANAQNMFLLFNQGEPFAKQIERLSFEMPVHDSTIELNILENADISKALNVHKAVIGQLRHILVPFSFQKFPLPCAKTTEKLNSGTGLDIARVIQSKLNTLGIQNELVYGIPNTLVNEQVGSFSSIDDVFVMVPVKTGDPLLLPVGRIPSVNPLFTDFNRALVRVDDGRMIPLYPKNMNFAELSISMTPGFEKTEVAYNGQLAGVYAGWPESKVDVAHIMNQVKKESEIDMKTKDLASFDIKGKFEAAQNVYENYLKVSLPELSSGIQRVVRHQLPQEEKFDIEVAYPLTEKYEYVIPLSNDFEIVETPVQVAIDNRLFNLKVNVQKSDKELVIKKTISIKSTRISASEYNEFRSFVQNLKADKQNQFIIKKK